MFNKKNLLLTTLMVTGAALLVLTQTAGSKKEPIQLEGAWISRVPDTALQWSSVISPTDSSGRRAVVSSSLQVAIPAPLMAPELFPEFDYNSPIVGEAVLTGHDKADFTTVGYSIKKVVPSAEYPFTERVAFIWVSSGEMEFTGPGKSRTTHHVAYYLPSADVDGDGLPDTGQAPFLCLPPTTSIDTRVSLMPPCVP